MLYLNYGFKKHLKLYFLIRAYCQYILKTNFFSKLSMDFLWHKFWVLVPSLFWTATVLSAVMFCYVGELNKTYFLGSESKSVSSPICLHMFLEVENIHKWMLGSQYFVVRHAIHITNCELDHYIFKNFNCCVLQTFLTLCHLAHRNLNEFLNLMKYVLHYERVKISC